jgi:hypothetical protein
MDGQECNYSTHFFTCFCTTMFAAGEYCDLDASDTCVISPFQRLDTMNCYDTGAEDILG